MKRSPLPFAAAVLSILLLAHQAPAEDNFVLRDVTRGVMVPSAYGLAGDFDATATSGNPAGLATLGGFGAAFTATSLASATVRGGGGWGAFIALPLLLPMRSDDGEAFRLTYGFGWQSLDAPSSWRRDAADVGPEPYDATYFLNSIAFGSSHMSVGWTVARVNWANATEAEGTTTHHVGLNLRLSRFVAGGVVVRDVFAPTGRNQGERFARALDAEIALRPLGDWRLEIAGGAVIGTDDLVDWRGRALWRPVRGLTVFAHLESAQRRFVGTGGAPAPAPGVTARDLRMTAGLSFDLGIGRRAASAGASYAALTSTRHLGAGEGGPAYAGSSVLIHAALERFPSLIEPTRFERLEIGGEIDERRHLANLVRMDDLARTPAVKGLVLLVGDSNLGWGRSEEVREAVERLRARGKTVIAYLKSAGMREYYAAAGADRVLLHPTSRVDLKGIAAMHLFARNLLDRIGVGVEVIQMAEYKTGMEMFSRTAPSDGAREQIGAYITEVHERFVAAVARARKMPEPRLRALMERPYLTPPLALSEGLVDALAHEDDLEERVGTLLGRKLTVERDRAPDERPMMWVAPQIAVVHLDGEIIEPAPGSTSPFGMQRPPPSAVARAIRDARESPRVRAIVLRVNSPGGMVQPSEAIAREVELTRGKKPILASFGDVAASGGYWVSAPADQILAPPSAITGSIGVLGLRVDLSRVAGRLGFTWETQKSGLHADETNPLRPATADETAARTAEMAYIYDRFLERVSRGRQQTREAVHAIGRGRIWSGSAARTHRLVDQLAGLNVALDEARRRAGVARDARIDVISMPADNPGLVQRLLAPPAADGGGGFPARAFGAPAVDLPPPVKRLLSAAVSPLIWYQNGAVVRWPWAEVLVGEGAFR